MLILNLCRLYLMTQFLPMTRKTLIHQRIQKNQFPQKIPKIQIHRRILRIQIHQKILKIQIHLRILMYHRFLLMFQMIQIHLKTHLFH